MAQEIANSTLLDTWGSGGNIVEPDISKIIEGWQLGEQPPHEYMNWLQNTFGSKLNHILKNGIAKWDSETQYLAGSSAQHNGNVWLCKATNKNSEPTDVNLNWKRIITVESLTTVLGGYVKNSGDETIAGVKTFSSSPIVPTPTTNTQVANKQYVDTLYVLDVHLTGNQTIAGIKTFSSSPIVPTPTTDFQASTKKYVDDSINIDVVTITGSATFSPTGQTIAMSGIGSITLAIGDVIQVAGTVNNNKLFTVENIPNVNQIVVNYEHRGTSTPVPMGRLIAETATATITLYKRAKDAQSGDGQYWCIPASGRTINTDYTATPNRGIQISIFQNTGSAIFPTITVDGFTAYKDYDGTSAFSGNVDVYKNGVYRYNSTTTTDLEWWEQR